MASHCSRGLEPDFGTAAHFLCQLDEYAERWTFQTFDDNSERKDPSLAHILHGTLEERAATLRDLNERGAGIFVTINETDLKGRKRENIDRVRAVWQEDDGEGKSLPLEPHIVVESSPGKYHRYLFVDGLEFDEHRCVQQVLVDRYGSDPCAKDISRVLRLPGFYHRKSEPHLVRIIEENHAQPYSRDDILRSFKPQAVPATADDASGDDVIPDGNRNTHLTSLAGTMRRRGMSEEAIAAALQAENEVRCAPALSATEVRDIARSVSRYEPEDGAVVQYLVVERAMKSAENGDLGALFGVEFLQCLAAMKTNDRGAFESYRAKLKIVGCRVGAIDDAVAEASGESGGRRTSQADVLIDLAADAVLFHTADGIGYADLKINDHRETWVIRSKGFRRWLTRRFFEVTQGAPNSEAMQSALNLIEARAHFDAPQAEVNIRVAGHADKLYLDLADANWRAIEIDSNGWRVINEPPARFRRAAGMQPLPEPTLGGSVDMLRQFLNVSTDQDFVLVIAWILAVLRNKGPYPVIVLSGEQGSAKSSFSAILRALVDPNAAPLRALPREDRDLFIAATNGHVLTFDNVSGLPAWISDTLCRLATGGGFAVRQLYTDQDEVLFDATRPVVLNGIEDIVTRPDLADRALFLTLEPIPEERRLPEKELWAAFDRVRPQILGALLNAVSHGLRRLPETRLEKLPRMADFAVWATACETALWPAGTFDNAYSGNRDEAVDNIIESDPVGAAISSMMTGRTEWTGTATDLLGALDDEVGEKAAKAKTWPSSARALSGRLRRAATFLRKVGIDVSFDRRGRARTRTIRIICTPENSPTKASVSSAPSSESGYSLMHNHFSDDETPTITTVADTNTESPTHDTARAIGPIFHPTDGVDGSDANDPDKSGS